MPAVRLAEHVWLVGGPHGAASTSPYDGNQFLVWEGSSGFLVDCGTGLGSDSWLSNIEEVAPLESLAGVIVTHYHGDHAGGSATASRAGIRVFGSRQTSTVMRTGDELITQVSRARELGVYPPEFRLEPCPGIEVLSEDTPLRVGRLLVTALDSPGHCDGHIIPAATLPNPTGGQTAATALFTGDTVFAGGTIAMQAIPDCRLDRYAETVIRLASLNVDQFYPGHGDAVTSRSQAAADLEAAAEPFRRLLPPPNRLS